MKFTIEHDAEGTTKVTFAQEGSPIWGSYTTQSQYLAHWTHGKALNRQVDVQEGADDALMAVLELSHSGPVGRTAVMIMAASCTWVPENGDPLEVAVADLDRWYPEDDVSRRALGQISEARLRVLQSQG